MPKPKAKDSDVEVELSFDHDTKRKRVFKAEDPDAEVQSIYVSKKKAGQWEKCKVTVEKLK